MCVHSLYYKGAITLKHQQEMKCRDNICQEPEDICFVSLLWQEGDDKAITHKALRLACSTGSAAMRQPHKAQLKTQKLHLNCKAQMKKALQSY